MTNYKYTDVKIAAKGNWLTIITALTSDMDKAVKQIGKHVSCPVHGGKDGFRLFKDADNTGGGICNTCGAKSTGFDLIMWINDWDFKTCLKAIGDYLMLNLNEVKPLQPIKRKYNNINQKTQKAKSYSSEKINQLWNECVCHMIIF